ncbi:MAG: adenine phosphoribosyltransferase [Leptospiraceae bacterium]|nr:adenine phosphoribosyltransferase [Leptospiraceae bacterium]MDW8306996.1 adenine phosphoribosyltransferase [Leptospiraceae bacterium]
MEHALRQLIRTIPDFPRPGIQFKDITPLLQDARGFRMAIDWFSLTVNAAGEVDLVAGIESRGFILGAALAARLGVGFIPLRKQGKLPAKKARVSYQLEYGNDALEMHVDAVRSGDRVALVDDLLATGGTAEAACQLLQQCGAEIVAVSFLIELDFLQGRKNIKSVKSEKIFSLIHY